MFDEDTGTIFRDVITLALAGFVAVVIVLLPWVNPPGTSAEAETDAPGDVAFEISWPAELDTDVDLWVQAPGQVPVGYSNKGGVSCNLLRDDLGHFRDPHEINHEVTVCRGISTSGEYVMNVHLYRNTARVLPIPVTTRVSVRPSDRAMRELLRSKITIEQDGQERTVVRFRLTETGQLEPGSVHSQFKPLRRFGSS